MASHDLPMSSGKNGHKAKYSIPPSSTTFASIVGADVTAPEAVRSGLLRDLSMWIVTPARDGDGAATVQDHADDAFADRVRKSVFYSAAEGYQTRHGSDLAFRLRPIPVVEARVGPVITMQSLRSYRSGRVPGRHQRQRRRFSRNGCENKQSLRLAAASCDA